MTNARMIDDHAPVHDMVLVAQAGDRLRVVRADDEWPGWSWCTAESGVSSWVPDPYLERDGDSERLLADYDATELTVSAGDQLTLHHEVNGWWWATAENGDEGWVPAAKIEVV